MESDDYKGKHPWKTPLLESRLANKQAKGCTLCIDSVRPSTSRYLWRKAERRKSLPGHQFAQHGGVWRLPQRQRFEQMRAELRDKKKQIRKRKLSEHRKGRRKKYREEEERFVFTTKIHAGRDEDRMNEWMNGQRKREEELCLPGDAISAANKQKGGRNKRSREGLGLGLGLGHADAKLFLFTRSLSGGRERRRRWRKGPKFCVLNFYLRCFLRYSSCFLLAFWGNLQN